MAKKNNDGYLSAKESRRISKANRRITNQLEKQHKRKNVPESEYLTQMKDRANVLEIDNLHTYFFTDVGTVHSVDGISFNVPIGKTVGVVGESGCGKSTISALLMGRNKGYTGSMTVGGAELRDIEEASLMRRITYVSHQSYLFKGTVRDNLLMGKPGASDDELWSALTQVNLADFLRGEAGLDTLLSERGENLSGGQRQRLALARALLHDSPVYIFDEATSNIDVESENDIMAQIHALAGRKTVLLISHRLANVTASDEIYVLERGNIVQHGTHDALLKQGGAYAALWSAQQVLEHYGEEAAK